MSGPHDDNPVEALVRHKIEVHSSPQAELLHNMMAVLITLIGVGMVLSGLWQLFGPLGPFPGIMLIMVGAFLAFLGPWGRRQIREDIARKSAAALYQLEQAKLWRQRNGM